MVVKTGISLPDDLYAELVRLARSMGYASVSRVIRDAVEAFIAFNRWWMARGRVFGLLMAVTHASDRPASCRLEELLEGYPDVVKGAARFTVGPFRVFVVFVEGEGARVKELYRSLVRLRGVLAVQASLLPGPGPEEPHGQGVAEAIG